MRGEGGKGAGEVEEDACKDRGGLVELIARVHVPVQYLLSKSMGGRKISRDGENLGPQHKFCSEFGFNEKWCRGL